MNSQPTRPLWLDLIRAIAVIVTLIIAIAYEQGGIQ